MIKIGIIKEGKIPADKRVLLSPKQIFSLQNEYNNDLEFAVEPSNIRCFSDEEYQNANISLSDTFGMIVTFY
jgi:saccharopine dehydrogenase (NAD+, L-lysine forming)